MSKIKEFEKLLGLPAGTYESLLAEDGEASPTNLADKYRKSQQDLWMTQNKSTIEQAAGDAAINGYLMNKGKKELADLAGVVYTRKELDAMTYDELREDVRTKLNANMDSLKTATQETVNQDAEQWKSKFIDLQKQYDTLELSSEQRLQEAENKATSTIKSFKRDNFLLGKLGKIDYAIESRKAIDQEYLMNTIQKNYDVDPETGAIEKKGGGPAPSLDGATTWTNVDQAIAYLDDQNKISKKSFGATKPQATVNVGGNRVVVEENLTDNQKKMLASEKAVPSSRNGILA